MDLSPNDIRNYEFPTQLRGYDKDEVDKFKDQVAEEIERLKQENLKFSMQAESYKEQLEGLRQFEDTIKSAAIDARRNADLTLTNAKEEADAILKKARTEADRLIESHSAKMAQCDAQLTDLKLARNSYVAKFRQLLTHHTQLVSQITLEDVNDPVTVEQEDRIDVTDSSEMKSKNRETIATPPSKDTAIRTEEGQAVGDADDDVPAELQVPVEPDQAQEPVQAEQPEGAAQPSEESNIDPELAAALDNYQQGVDDEEAGISPAPAQDEIVETTARAEDIPEGFYAKDDDDSQEVVTDHAEVAPDAQDQPTEHSSISMDDDVATPGSSPALDPDKLAKELDSVVAKFEEEMAKAEKS